MLALFLLLALLLVLVGHAFRLLRWEQFIRIYERPPRGQMLRGMAGGYALNFVLPFHLGDAFRAVYTGRRMKSGIGFALAIILFSTVRERLEFADYPKCFEGFPIALVTAALLSMAFMGFQGMKIF